MSRVGELNQEDAKLDRERLKEEKKKLKNEKKEQRKAAKARAKELADQEEELMEESGGAGSGSVFLVTFIIVLIWVAILCLVIKLDFGGFGSNVLTPVLKDVPVLNKILPNTMEENLEEGGGEETYGGYKSLQEAVDYIKELELS